MTRSTTRQSLKPPPARSVLTTLAATFLLLLVLVPFTASAAQVDANLPRLHSAASLSPQSGQVAIRGDGFSPGGLVYLSFSGGLGLFRIVATEAGTTVYGPNGSADPALGYVEGGVVSALLALDSPTIFGTNGSQDPAQGYVPAVERTATACIAGVSVQAFDAETRAWSNSVEVTLFC